mgnify:CR=1 FL=1
MGRNSFDVDDRLLLMRAVCHEDRRALAILYLKYAPAVRSHISSQVGSPADIQDLVHDVFLHVWQGKGGYDKTKGAKPYVFGIASKIVRRYRREKARAPQTMPTDSMNGLSLRYRMRESSDAAGQNSTRRLKSIITDMQRVLPPEVWQAIRLRFVEGLSVKEAAGKLGCSKWALYKRLQRAKKLLRDALKAGL